MLREVARGLAFFGSAVRKAGTILFAMCLAGCATTADLPPVEFPKEWFGDTRELRLDADLRTLETRVHEVGALRVRSRLETPIGRERVFVQFDGSESMARRIAEDLRRRGVTVVEQREQADVELRMEASIGLNGRFGHMVFFWGPIYEAALKEGTQAVFRAAVTANAFGGQYGQAAGRIVSSELAARMIGMSLAARGSNIIGALVDASPRRQRSNYEAYGDVRGNCFGSLCYRRAWFVHGIAIQALAKRGDKTERAFVFGPVWMLQVDPFPVFDLAYGVLVRDGLGLSPGEPRWADLEKARKDAQGGEDKRREGMP